MYALCLERMLIPRQRPVASETHLPERCPAMDYSGFQASCHIAPSLGLFVPNNLSMFHHSFFSEVPAHDVFLWLGFFSAVTTPQ
jgi:hypothetical protein